jgi:hypothetical protein
MKRIQSSWAQWLGGILVGIGVGFAGPAQAQLAIGNVVQNAQRATVLDPAFYVATYPDLRAAFGSNGPAAVSHWVEHGLREGRQPRADFDPGSYMARYPDVKRAVGDNYTAALDHFLLVGRLEGRTGDPAQPYPPAVLVRQADNGMIFLIDANRQRRWITSLDVFNGCGLAGTVSQNLAPRVMGVIAAGANLTNARDCQLTLAAARAAAQPKPDFAAGTLLRAPSGGIYVIDAARNRRWVRSMDVYNACGIAGQPLVGRAQDVVNAVAEGAPLDSAASCRALLDSIGFLPAPGTVRVRNTCGDTKSIAIKNDENGQYQRLINNSTDAQIPPGLSMSYPVSGRRFYAHFSGLPHLVGISTQFAADTERDLELRQDGGNCVIRVAARGASGGAAPTLSVNITNLCGEIKSIAIKNDDTGVYQKLDGERTDVQISPSASRQASLQGTRFYAHFSGLAHLSNISTQFTAPNSEIMLRREGGQCVVRAGSMTAAAEAQAVTIRVMNACTAAGSVAIKSNTSGDYQRIDGNRTDLALEPGKSSDVTVFGREFWAHWSGRTDLGVLANGPGVLSMLPGGTPCRLSFTPGGVDAALGSFRIAELRSSNADRDARSRHAARVTARLVEIFNVPGAVATPAEQALIRQLEDEITRMRIQSAERAISDFDAWYVKNEEEALKRNARNLMGMLYYGTKPPESFKNMALSGVPLLSDGDSQAFAEIMRLVGINAAGAFGAMGGATIGLVATSITSAVFPYAQAVGTMATVGAMGGAAAGAGAVAGLMIAGFAIADMVTIENYRPDLVNVLNTYRASRFSVAAAARSDPGRRQLLTYLAFMAR